MGTLSRIISCLSKNKVNQLQAKDFISLERSSKKLKNKKTSLINALIETNSLKELNLIQYELKTAGKQFISLTELITSIANNTSLELLDLSHNAFTHDISLALVKVITTKQVPLKHLSLSYLLNFETTDLDNVIIALQENSSLLSLNLYGNELNTSTCQELVKLIKNKEIVLNELNLSRCLLSSIDLAKIKEACVHKSKKFSLLTDQILLTDSFESSPSTLKENSSLKIIKALSKPIASSRSQESSGSAETLSSSCVNSSFFATAKENSEIIRKQSIFPTQEKQVELKSYSFSLAFQ